MNLFILKIPSFFTISRDCIIILILIFILLVTDTHCQVFITPVPEENQIYLSDYFKILKKQYSFSDSATIKVIDKNGNSKGQGELFDTSYTITVTDNGKKFVFTNNQIIKPRTENLLPSNRTVLVDLQNKGLKTIIGASGDIKTVITGEDNNSIATGSLEIRFEQSSLIGYQVTGAVSIAASDDTIKSNYGSSLLIPQTGKNSALLDVAFYKLISRNIPLIVRAYFFISTTSWEGSIDSTAYAEDGSIFGGGILIGGQIFGVQDENKENNAALTLYTGFTYRSLLGDLNSNTFLRESFLNTDSNNFPGWEVDFMAYYKKINVGLTLYYFFEKDIPGLSNGQVTGGISFAIDLIKF